MKDVRSVKMYMNAIYILTIDISADMTTFIYNKTALARINGLTNKHSRKQPCSNYQIVIFFHIHSKAIYD
jgi:hypothetical protein